jgi:hypothetical protein
MKKSRFTPGQILQALRQAEGGTVVSDICRNLGSIAAAFPETQCQLPRVAREDCHQRASLINA